MDIGRTSLIISILAILFVILLFLIILEKKFRKKFKLQKKSRNLFYKRKIKKLSKLKLNPQEFLDAINNLARDFFEEAFDLPDHLEYSELINEFKKTGKKECITFCGLTSELSYSGKSIEKNKLSVLIKLLEKIVEKNKILSEEEKKEMKGIKEEKEKKDKIKEKRQKKKEIKELNIKELPATKTASKKPEKRKTKKKLPVKKPKKKLRK